MSIHIWTSKSDCN